MRGPSALAKSNLSPSLPISNLLNLCVTNLGRTNQFLFHDWLPGSSLTVFCKSTATRNTAALRGRDF